MTDRSVQTDQATPCRQPQLSTQRWHSRAVQSSRPYARTAAGQVAHARPGRPDHEPTTGQVAGRGDKDVTWVILSGPFARHGLAFGGIVERLCRMARTALTEYSFCNPGLPVGSRHFVVADVVATGINVEATSYAKPAEPTVIWIKRLDGRIERWARLGRLEGCA